MLKASVTHKSAEKIAFRCDLQGLCAMGDCPFSVFKRNGGTYYYVSFKNETTGGFMSAISTKQTNKAAAIKTAWAWHSNGIPRKEKKQTIAQRTLIDTARIADITIADATKIIAELKKRGLVKAAIMAGSKADRDFIEYLTEFWDYENSPYVKEKLRKNHGIHKMHCMRCASLVSNYWKPFFEGRLLGSITRADIDAFIDKISTATHKKGGELAAKYKNTIVNSGVTALRWAYSKSLIDTDITQGIVFFAGKSKERNILTPETVEALFSHDWHDGRAKLASMLSCVTGMRAGEILGLRGVDLGDGCLYVRHSWNEIDGLKTTKNNENRIVLVAFPAVMAALVELARRNPHGQGADGFVFYSDAVADKPFDEHILLKKLRGALVDIGMSRDGAKKYTFHSWRHYYTSYMKPMLDAKLLQSQTGHKTLAMLEHYGAHETAGDVQKIQSAQQAAFGGLLPDYIDIGKKERLRDAHGRLTAWAKGA
jgi:integrase